MRKIIFTLILVTMLISMASAEIIINNQPNEIYNLGDSFSIPVTIKTLTEVTDIFNMDLICEGQTINFYKNGVSLLAGQEKKIDSSLILAKNLIGSVKGNCKIKATLGEKYTLTNEFKISDQIILTQEIEQTELNPGESFLVKGNAVKENGKSADGFIKLEIILANNSEPIDYLETINNGFFSINVTLPTDLAAKKYLLKLNAYEKNSKDEITNTGTANSNIQVKQVPTSLEIVFEEKEISPGKELSVKAILHDQTGENIDSTVKITIKDNQTQIIKQEEKKTNEFLKIPMAYNEKPLTWTVTITSNDLETESSFIITEKKDINTTLINSTLTVTNVGNVFYNDSLTLEIGNETRLINISLDVDETKEYELNAPDGEYDVTIFEQGENKSTQRVFLTGKTIVIEEKNLKSKFIFSFAWLFIILILGFVAYMFFKKNHKKTFFAYFPFLKKKEKKKTIKDEIPLKKDSNLKTKNPAIVSLTIKGDKQKATTTCLFVKDLKGIEETKESSTESLQKIIDFAEENKAFVYENQDNLCFILAPIKTRTFKNEVKALEISRTAKKILLEHNKLFKQKIEFGISINNGTIIAKKEKDSAKFMSMGTFITSAKKMAVMQREKVLISEDVKNRLASKIKVEKVKDQEGIYHIQGIKNYNNEENKKFIDNFVKKLEKESSKK